MPLTMRVQPLVAAGSGTSSTSLAAENGSAQGSLEETSWMSAANPGVAAAVGLSVGVG